MDAITYAQEVILKNMEEKVEIENAFEDYSDYSDDGGYGDSSGDWN